MTSSNFFKNRLTGLFLIMLSAAACLSIRAACIQLIKNARLERLAQRQFHTRVLTQPRRGSLLDRKGEILAMNQQKNSLAAHPRKIRNKKAVATFLARAIGVSRTQLLNKLNESKDFVWIKRHLTDSELLRFKKGPLVRSDGDWIEGLLWIKESERVYPYGQLAVHVLGDVNVDSEGLEGIELQYNERLRGKIFTVHGIQDARGRPTFIDVEAANRVQEGESLQLTIDAALQFEVERALADAIESTGAQSGTVIVMNAETGELLSLANAPTFNPHQKSVPFEHRRNRAVTDGYEPGSTFKAILLASALSHGWKLSDLIWGEKGSFRVQNHTITESEVREKFEWLSLKKMLQVSSNIGAAKLALQVGVERYLRTLKECGFGQKTGLKFPGEIAGRIPAKADWTPLTLATIGFGQGIFVTPLQMTRAYAALVNGGWLVEPKLLKSTPLSVHRVRVFSSEVSHRVLEALEAVTQEGGTGTHAVLPGYRIGGKTGTAQKVEAGKYSKTKYVASFIGFPLGCSSKIVIFTSLTDLRGNYYAATTAAPLFRNVFSSVAHHYELLPSEKVDHILASELKKVKKPSHPSAQPAQRPTLEEKYSNAREWIMPALRGMTAREVLQLFRGRDLQLEVTGTGFVSTQIPLPGKTLAEGDTIRVRLSEL